MPLSKNNTTKVEELISKLGDIQTEIDDISGSEDDDDLVTTLEDASFNVGHVTSALNDALDNE